MFHCCEMTPRQMKKRKERESKSSHVYENEEKYQYPIEEFDVRCSSDKSAKVWRYFGDLYHHDRLVCDRVYCSVCLESQKNENSLLTLASLMPRIKNYAKSVSTGNLAIHLNDKHEITFLTGNGSPRAKSRKMSRVHKNSETENTTTDNDEHSNPVCSNFVNNSIDSSDEFEEDQEPSVIARTIQKHAVDILSQMSTTESLSNLIHQFRSLMRLSRSNYRELLKSRRDNGTEGHHYMVSMQFLWNLIKSAIVLWKGMSDNSLSAYLEAIQFVYKAVPPEFKSEEELELLGHVLILISGSVKCCDQSTLVLFAETID